MSAVSIENSLIDRLGVSTAARTDAASALEGRSLQGQQIRVAETFFEGSDLSKNQGSWIMIRDQLSETVASMSLVQIAEEAVESIASKLGELQSAIEIRDEYAKDSAEYAAQQVFVDSYERQLSRLIGASSLRQSERYEVAFDANVSTSLTYTEVLGLGTTLGDIAVVEVDNRDVLQSFHAVDGCPICRQKVMADGGNAEVSAVADATTIDATAQERTSVDGSLTANDDTNTLILSNTQWATTTPISYSVFDRDGDVGYDYGSITGTWANAAAGALTSSLNMADGYFIQDVYKGFEAWDNVIDLSFEPVREAENSVGDLRVAFSNGVSETTGAFAGPPGNTAPLNGDIFFNSEASSNWTLAPGTKGFQRLLHEIGHAINLSHPHDFSGLAASSLRDVGAPEKDTWRYTVMTYNYGGVHDDDGELTGSFNPFYDRNKHYTFNPEWNGSFVDLNLGSMRIAPSTPMLLDIEAAEFMYGVSSSNAGGTVHDVSDFGDAFLATITDSGDDEVDTLDASSTTRSNVINLTAGEFSSINTRSRAELYAEIRSGMEAVYAENGVNYTDASVQDWIDANLGAIDAALAFDDANSTNPTADDGDSTNGGTALYEGQDNLAIARSAKIENAIGGSAADTITGNTFDNAIKGGGGDDTIDGGDGTDTAVFEDDIANYVISYSSDSGATWTVWAENDAIAASNLIKVEHSGSDGTDILENIEKLEFSDKLVTVSDGSVGKITSSSIFGGTPSSVVAASEYVEALTSAPQSRGVFERAVDELQVAEATVSGTYQRGFERNETFVLKDFQTSELDSIRQQLLNGTYSFEPGQRFAVVQDHASANGAGSEMMISAPHAGETGALSTLGASEIRPIVEAATQTFQSELEMLSAVSRELGGVANDLRSKASGGTVSTVVRDSDHAAAEGSTSAAKLAILREAAIAVLAQANLSSEFAGTVLQ